MTQQASLERWRHLWADLGAAAPGAVFDALVARYSEPHRKYHTLRHLNDCLEALNEARSEAEHPAEVECALWFHDAIYDPRRHDNETQSAEWARTTALNAQVDRDSAARIHALILATQHQALPATRDEKLVVDIDLSILGARPERFDEYERDVRAEYAWVPDPVFRAKRREILETFLARPTIFNTMRFITTYEAQARANLQRSISSDNPRPK